MELLYGVIKMPYPVKPYIVISALRGTEEPTYCGAYATKQEAVREFVRVTFQDTAYEEATNDQT